MIERELTRWVVVAKRSGEALYIKGDNGERKRVRCNDADHAVRWDPILSSSQTHTLVLPFCFHVSPFLFKRKLRAAFSFFKILNRVEFGVGVRVQLAESIRPGSARVLVGRKRKIKRREN